jgi:hypothetical protein
MSLVLSLSGLRRDLVQQPGGVGLTDRQRHHDHSVEVAPGPIRLVQTPDVGSPARTAAAAPPPLQVAAGQVAGLPDEGELPSLDGATRWLNSPPLTPAGLRGKVVVAGFGPIPASTGCASFPTSTPGPRNTPATGWW